MRTFLKFCTILSIVIATIKIVMMSRLTPDTAVFIMIGALIILAGNKTLYTITAAIMALVLFLKVYGDTTRWDNTILQSVIALAIMLLGIFVMLRGVFPSSHSGNRP